LTDPTGCLLCNRNALVDTGAYPYSIAVLSTGYVNLMECQFYEGTVEFVCRVCASELHELDPTFRSRYLGEMALVADAVWRAFGPRKLNYEALGNAVPHLHWRVIPRGVDDPNPRGPIWENPVFLEHLHAGTSAPTAGRREELKRRRRLAFPASPH
jgi:diadenosine tetraphosphate (Ap4A) HIT family hydrolase